MACGYLQRSLAFLFTWDGLGKQKKSADFLVFVSPGHNKNQQIKQS
jgi:hypothetical protein